MFANGFFVLHSSCSGNHCRVVLVQTWGVQNITFPCKVFLTDGKSGERPFVDQILAEGQTGVMNRGYQSHRDFDLLQEANKHFVCRIKVKTTRTIIEKRPIAPDSHIFYDALVRLGTSGQNQTEKPVRVVGYEIAGSKYYVATDRQDLAAEQIATAYKLRWTTESFFQWWKEHLKVYHLIARSKHGLMVQIIGGLITYMRMLKKHHLFTIQAFLPMS